MGVYTCMICDDKVAAQAVNEQLAKGMSGAAVARLMTLRGFSVSAPTVIGHKGHQVIVAPAGLVTKRDLATMVRDKVADELEGGKLDILDKMAQGAIKAGLSAEKMLDTRAARKDDKALAFALATLLSGGGPAGFLAPPELTGEDDGLEDDENIIEGEAVRLDG